MLNIGFDLTYYACWVAGLWGLFWGNDGGWTFFECLHRTSSPRFYRDATPYQIGPNGLAATETWDFIDNFIPKDNEYEYY